MRQFETGKRVLLPWSQTNYGPARRGQAGISWYVDETYIKVCGKWCYLYRAIDSDGNLVDSRRSRKAEYGRRPTVLQASHSCGWSRSRAGDDRWASFLSPCSTRNAGK